jgi:hypothetical protein
MPVSNVVQTATNHQHGPVPKHTHIRHAKELGSVLGGGIYRLASTRLLTRKRML